ncbi:hypothetical protein [Actinoplanes utahensis]|uniref:Gram-positive cocci surface proteins LPxTG domain-containing protein n=1 Tax=Actinoplanes utahensis TaxID=1869 RepID=A0A0A6UHR5_ACTUT|nr:hypothetical protein [Actinoplanes utahensis]KHD73849.1 hypothetical protein MB27_33005 [Actinoplanes utahensis]GIF27761.1 hypothetical protein Aut01nite_07470 [Actinoplanes utahensis]
MRRLAAVFSVLVLLLFPLAPSAKAEPAEPRRPEATESVPDLSELPGGGLSPMLLAAIGGYLLTGGLALLLLKR